MNGRGKYVLINANRAYRLAPNELDVLLLLADLALAQFDMRAGRPDLAERRLREGLSVRGDSTDLTVLLTEALLDQGKLDAALDGQRMKLDWRQQEPRLRELAVAYHHHGDLPEAERWWRQLAAKQPDRLGIRLRLLDLAFRIGDDRKVIEALKGIRRIEGAGGTSWQLGEATRLIRSAKSGNRQVLQRAENLLHNVSLKAATIPAVQIGLAEISDLRGDDKQAVDYYLHAIELGERNPEVFRRAVLLLHKRRRFFDAQKLLDDFKE